MTKEDAFRAEVRAWLEENCPASKRGLCGEDDSCFGGMRWKFKDEDQRLWLERMASRGWTAPEWPKIYGGGGLSATQANILREELARIDAFPALSSLGIWMLGPALLKFGTEEQKRKYLPPIVRGEVRWCQGYSEPNAGSDLVSLQTRAEKVGDHFIVNGQKIWTTFGYLSDWMFGLVRTNPTKPRHEGISFILLDMHSSGVTVQRFKMLSGAEHFAQVFFDNVKVPVENLVGTLDRGWDVAKYLLNFERAMIGAVNRGESSKLLPFALKHLGIDGLRAEPALRAKIVELAMEIEAFETMLTLYGDEAAAGATLGAKSSMLKYFATELAVKREEMKVSILGLAGLDLDSSLQYVSFDWLMSLPNRMGGGSSEIQLNVVSKRVLELPS